MSVARFLDLAREGLARAVARAATATYTSPLRRAFRVGRAPEKYTFPLRGIVQRLLLLVIALLLLASHTAFAKGPQKLEVEEYADMNAAPDAVWGKIRNLNDLNEPHPAVDSGRHDDRCLGGGPREPQEPSSGGQVTRHAHGGGVCSEVSQ